MRYASPRPPSRSRSQTTAVVPEIATEMPTRPHLQGRLRLARRPATRSPRCRGSGCRSIHAIRDRLRRSRSCSRPPRSRASARTRWSAVWRRGAVSGAAPRFPPNRWCRRTPRLRRPNRREEPSPTGWAGPCGRSGSPRLERRPRSCCRLRRSLPRCRTRRGPGSDLQVVRGLGGKYGHGYDSVMRRGHVVDADDAQLRVRRKGGSDDDRVT